MRGIAIYTGLRLALLAGVWRLIQVVTPMRGLLAIAVALVVSGVISFILLDRPRDRASAGLSGVFRRIDERIERSKVAEDIDEDPVTDDPAPSGQVSGEGESRAEQQSVGQDEQAGGLEHGHEGASGGTADDSEHGSQGKGSGDDAEPREGQVEPTR